MGPHLLKEENPKSREEERVKFIFEADSGSSSSLEVKSIPSRVSVGGKIIRSEGDSARKHPAYKCNEVQTKAAEDFLAVLRSYFESFFSDFRSQMYSQIMIGFPFF